MKVLYDYQAFTLQKYGGISRYFSELMSKNEESDLSLLFSDNYYLTNEIIKKFKILPEKHEYNSFLPSINFKGKERIIRLYRKLLSNDNINFSINKIKYSNYEIFHPTYYNTYFLKYLKNRPFVLTVHDMIHELFPHFFSKTNNTSSNKFFLMKKAKLIIAVSEHTKNDIIKFLPEVTDKIIVINHGFSWSHNNRFSKKEDYLLFVGSRYNYKNFDLFTKAISPILINNNLKLFCIGNSFTNKEKATFDELGIANKTICKSVSDIELAEIYSKALAFIFPSIYEGFGIPVLEAFASGCPAILSNTSSLPEVGGDAAVYFDPYNIEDMRNQIEKVITSSTLQNTMINNGYQRLKNFSWEKCANETMNAYKKLIS